VESGFSSASALIEASKIRKVVLKSRFYTCA
jgi:hypothetical protein